MTDSEQRQTFFFSKRIFGRAVPHLVRQYASLAPRGLAVDLGCGEGSLVDWLTDHGIAALGIDRQLAPSRHSDHRFVEQKIEEFELAAYQPTLLVARHVLHFLPSSVRTPLLAGMFAALAPGGLLIIESFLGEQGFKPGELAHWLLAHELKFLHYSERWECDQHPPEGAHIHAVVSLVARKP